MERCSRMEGNGLHRLEGTVLTFEGVDPIEIRYAITCNDKWTTRACTVNVESAGSARRIKLQVSDDSVRVRDAARMGEFAGIADIDLGFSPCTNTLPIRRLALAVGETARVTVAWLRFPGFEVVRAEQVYSRLAACMYRSVTARHSEQRGGQSPIFRNDNHDSRLHAIGGGRLRSTPRSTAVAARWSSCSPRARPAMLR